MNLNFNWRVRAGLSLLGLAFAGAANAQWVLGPVTLNNDVADFPGLGGGLWQVNGFDYFAGVINWNGGALSTICSSLNQNFSAGDVFSTDAYWLSGATATPDGYVTLGDGSTQVALPDVDVNTAGTSGYTNANFLQAAEIFGGLYFSQADLGNSAFASLSTAEQNARAAALQIAIWETLYPSYSATVTDPTLAGYVAADLASGAGTDQLVNVDWYEYTNGGGGGQSQFGYVDNGGNLDTPEPATMLIAGGAFLFGLRRRHRRAR